MSNVRMRTELGLVSGLPFTRPVERIGEAGRWTVIAPVGVPVFTPVCIETKEWDLLPAKGEMNA